jgi:hypothetical protein
MPIFGRGKHTPPAAGPAIPPAEQRRLIRESDRAKYAASGFAPLSAYAYGSDLAPGALSIVIHDQLTDRNPPERSAVQVGVHDAQLARAIATVLGERYSKASVTIGQPLPEPGDTSLEGRRLRAVLLFGPDGAEAERERVRQVVERAHAFAAQVPNPSAVRRAVVEQLTREHLTTGHRVKLALAAAWIGQSDIAAQTVRELASDLSDAAMQRLAEQRDRS